MDAEKIDKDKIKVKIPPYRADFLHEVDIIEDIAVAYGYNNFEPVYPNVLTIGNEKLITKFTYQLQDLLIGFGFQEVHNFIMTDPGILFEKMNSSPEPIIEIANYLRKTFPHM